MAILFLQKRKSQRNMILIFLAVILLAAFIVWQGFFKKKTEVFPRENPAPPKEEIIIDFEIFKNPLLKQLQPFPQIPLFEQTTSTAGLGRENPFVPY